MPQLEGARTTFYYTNGDPSGLAKSSSISPSAPDGQKIVDNVGFVGINEIK